MGCQGSGEGHRRRCGRLSLPPRWRNCGALNHYGVWGCLVRGRRRGGGRSICRHCSFCGQTAARTPYSARASPRLQPSPAVLGRPRSLLGAKSGHRRAAQRGQSAGVAAGLHRAGRALWLVRCLLARGALARWFRLLLGRVELWEACCSPPALCLLCRRPAGNKHACVCCTQVHVQWWANICAYCCMQVHRNGGGARPHRPLHHHHRRHLRGERRRGGLGGLPRQVSVALGAMGQLGSGEREEGGGEGREASLGRGREGCRLVSDTPQRVQLGAGAGHGRRAGGLHECPRPCAGEAHAPPAPLHPGPR